MSTIETVHVVFKTHLDIGFTDLAAHVIERYEKEFIPKAIELAEQLEAEAGSEGFIWTTGSWLIYRYLNRASDAEREKMESAIAKGHIRWHGLPFTTHTELMDESLFRYALSISQKLDKRFGKQTIASKMTDVPGHTLAIVPIMQEAGIRYMHIGVNRASKRPAVPSVFRWQAPCGAEVIVNYADNYGETLEIEGLKDALVFAHTGDNCGPPSIEDIRAEFAKIAAAYPGAVVKASTLDAFAEQLLTVKDRLPIVREEIGDTWIHGTATDPLKLTKFRECIRLRNSWLQSGQLLEGSEEYEGFSEALILVAEHTWGLDLKKWLPDFNHYAKLDFQAAKQRDEVDPENIPDKYKYIGAFAMNETDSSSKSLFAVEDIQRSYSFMESSWEEQRAYIDQAVQSLSQDKRRIANLAMEGLVPRMPDRIGKLERNVHERFQAGGFEVAFAADGSLIHLSDARGKRWVTDAHPFGLYVYETFGPENYDRWFQEYMQNLLETHMWSDADYGKPGFEYANPKPRHQEFRGIVDELIFKPEADADRITLVMHMPHEATNVCGAPKWISVTYVFHNDGSTIEAELQWFGKDASRLPEASWFSCGLEVDNPNLWMLNKMGQLISPLNVVKDGNRNLHAVWSGVSYQGTDGSVYIDTKDAAIVSPGQRRLLQFSNTFAPLEQGMHFNLHNNKWGTNFPMWYGEDAKFRFQLRFE
jgi:hypothetical protein